jgi:hypothetical protein
MLPAAPGNNSVDDQLQRVHWHILRGDSLRGAVASRAGTVLSTNALVVAGIALAFGLKNHKPGVVVTILAIAALGCVAASVMHATLATMTIRSWRRQFPQHQEHGGSPYSFVEIDSGAQTLEQFTQRIANQPTEQVLEDAVAELWQCAVLHRYRYLKLRVALRWLLAALCLLVAAITASALFP